MAIRLLSTTITTRLRGNWLTPTPTPTGMPNTAANRTDHAATPTEVQTAAKTSWSAEKIRESAVLKDSAMKPTAYLA